MTSIADVVSNLIGQTAFMNLTFGNLIMILVAFVFLFLAIKMGFEPPFAGTHRIRYAFGKYLSGYYDLSGRGFKRNTGTSARILYPG